MTYPLSSRGLLKQNLISKDLTCSGSLRPETSTRPQQREPSSQTFLSVSDERERLHSLAYRLVYRRVLFDKESEGSFIDTGTLNPRSVTLHLSSLDTLKVRHGTSPCTGGEGRDRSYVCMFPVFYLRYTILSSMFCLPWTRGLLASRRYGRGRRMGLKINLSLFVDRPNSSTVKYRETMLLVELLLD